MRKSVLKKLLVLLAVSFLMQGCVSLKPYERIYVNDPDMKLGLDAGLNFQNYIFLIREGAVQAGSAKASGGCGCNE